MKRVKTHKKLSAYRLSPAFWVSRLLRFGLCCAEAQRKFALAPSDSANTYSCVLGPSLVVGTVAIPAEWPANPRPLRLLSLTSKSGRHLPLDVAEGHKGGELGLVAMLEASAKSLEMHGIGE
jgi:hypothetical protein